MANNKTLWNKLADERVLRRGWHIAKAESARDLAELPYALDVIARDLPAYLEELANNVRAHKYRPGPLFDVDVPKGPLAIRPGSVILPRDRIVASAIILLIAPKLDSLLHDAVYSWRVKRPLPTTGEIFREGAIDELPFLKNKTIRKWIDPIEPWYALWPEFDFESKKVIIGPRAKYRYLATSDIAAYFENIQIPLLREHLLAGLPGERQIINLLCSLLESWVVKSADGYTPHRGIPQGTSIGSFLGNFFLHRLDEAILGLRKKAKIAYFRYMDDVRIFTNSPEDARLAIFTMIRTLRMMHLNVQTAKTKILDENAGEVTAALMDERAEELSRIQDDIQRNFKQKPVPNPDRARYLRELDAVAHKQASSEKGQPIVRARKPLEGLSSRVFRRWITAHTRLKSDAFVRRLVKEIERNPDDKLGQKLVTTMRAFPRLRGMEAKLIGFFNSPKNIFPYQEAQCLRALRYIGNPTPALRRHCMKRVASKRGDVAYLKIQAGMLLTRAPLTNGQLVRLAARLRSEPNEHVRCVIASAIVQRRPNAEFVRYLMMNPNEHLARLGALFHAARNDLAHARRELDFALDPNVPSRICDRMPFLHVMASSEKRDIRKLVADRLTENAIRAVPMVGIRNQLRQIRRDLRRVLAGP